LRLNLVDSDFEGRNFSYIWLFITTTTRDVMNLNAWLKRA